MSKTRPTIHRPQPPRFEEDLEAKTLTVSSVVDEQRCSAFSLTNLDLVETEASELEIKECVFEGTDFANAQLNSLTLTDARIARCNLANLKTRGGGLVRVIVSDSRLTGIDWIEGSGRDVSFQGCRADLASLRFTRLERVEFIDCQLSQADFANARLKEVRFEGCDLAEADFSHAKLERCEFRGCQFDRLKGVTSLGGAAMEWTDIVGLAGALAAAVGIKVLDESEDGTGHQRELR